MDNIEKYKIIIFENKKLPFIVKSFQNEKQLYFNGVFLGFFSEDETILDICWEYLFKNASDYFLLAVKTNKGKYYKKLDCNFNSFLDMIFQSRFIPNKLLNIIHYKPWIVGEVYEMEVN